MEYLQMLPHLAAVIEDYFRERKLEFTDRDGSKREVTMSRGAFTLGLSV